LVKASSRLVTMPNATKPKMEGASCSGYLGKNPNYSNYRTPSFITPTSGLEKVIFDYGPSMKKGEFKHHVEPMADSWLLTCNIMNVHLKKKELDLNKK